ncbi:MAG: tetratricopeptide repeat protein [Thauera sp.]|nr:tetratricopeptide repeat protein [Thauera sp.]
MNLPFRIVFLPFVALLTACAGLAPAPREPVPAAPEATAPVILPPAVAAAPDDAALSGDLLFDILLGEVAGQREQLDVSVSHYLRAAETSDDPRIAERALRIALFAKQEDAALTAARRWVELDPQRLEARQSLAVLALHARVAEEAYEQMEFLVAALPDETQAYQNLTGVLARSEDRELALALMARLVQKHPASFQARLAYSRLALHAENTELALQEVERALAMQPGAAEALILRAGIRVKAGEAELAQQELRAAVTAHPDDIDLRLALARLMLDSQDLKGAAEQFRQVVKRQPAHADAIYSLGLLALDQLDLKAAESRFRRLIQIGEREQEARYYLGRVLEQRKDYQEALDWYSLVSDGEYWLEAQIRAAGVRAELGDLDGARRQLQSLRLRDPQLAVRLYLVEGDVLTRVGELQQALDLYNTVLAENPGNHDVLYARALLFERLDDLSRAETDLKQIIAEDPNNFHAWNALGYTLADRTDRLQEALVYIEKAVELAPNEPAIIDSLGWVHYRLGNLELAAEHLQRAYDLSRGDAEVAAHYGEVLWQMGKRNEARALWEKARRADPDNRPLRKTLERFLP